MWLSSPYWGLFWESGSPAHQNKIPAHLYPHQYAFRTNSLDSTQSHPWSLLENWTLGQEHNTLQLDIGPPHKQTQRVWTGSRISYLLVLNNGVPQGHVLSPLLFTLQTHDCTPWHQNISIVRKGRWHHHHWPHYKQWCELLTLTLSLQLECLESSLQSP